MADLKSLKTKGAADEPQPLTLVDPDRGDDLLNDAGEPMKIWLVGKDSQIASDFRNRIHRQWRNKKAPGLAQTERIAAEMLATCTTSFENLQLNGETLEYSFDAAVQLYLDYKPIFEQADEFVSDRTNYLGKSESG